MIFTPCMCVCVSVCEYVCAPIHACLLLLCVHVISAISPFCLHTHAHVHTHTHTHTHSNTNASCNKLHNNNNKKQKEEEDEENNTNTKGVIATLTPMVPKRPRFVIYKKPSSSWRSGDNQGLDAYVLIIIYY